MTARTAVVYAPSGEIPELPAGVDPVAHTPDLGEAFDLVVELDAQALFVPQLRTVAGSLGEVVRLLDWLTSTGADLLSASPRLDTASPEGRRAVALIREIDGWGRDPEHPRRPRGRPGLAAASPELAERIADLRAQGLSLHAIAEELNRQGVPTPRGGSTWRASSVQSAIGYRRPPRPPGPPPSRHHGPHGPKPPGPQPPGPKHKKPPR